MDYKPIVLAVTILNTSGCARVIDDLLSGPREAANIEQADLYQELDKKIEKMIEKYSEVRAVNNVPISSKNTDIVKLQSGRSIESILKSTGYILPEGYIIENSETFMKILRIITSIKDKNLNDFLNELDDGNKVITYDELPLLR